MDPTKMKTVHQNKAEPATSSVCRYVSIGCNYMFKIGGEPFLDTFYSNEGVQNLKSLAVKVSRNLNQLTKYSAKNTLTLGGFPVR